MCLYSKCSVVGGAFSPGPKRQDLCSHFYSVPLLGTLEGRGNVAPSDFFALLGTPKKAGVMQLFRPTLALEKAGTASRDWHPPEMVIRNANRSKSPHRLGTLWCTLFGVRRAKEVSLLSTPPVAGVWAATTTVTLVRRDSGDICCCMPTP